LDVWKGQEDVKGEKNEKQKAVDKLAEKYEADEIEERGGWGNRKTKNKKRRQNDSHTF
jgi:hypothetical protein